MNPRQQNKRKTNKWFVGAVSVLGLIGMTPLMICNIAGAHAERAVVNCVSRSGKIQHIIDSTFDARNQKTFQVLTKRLEKIDSLQTITTIAVQIHLKPEERARVREMMNAIYTAR